MAIDASVPWDGSSKVPPVGWKGQARAHLPDKGWCAWKEVEVLGLHEGATGPLVWLQCGGDYFTASAVAIQFREVPTPEAQEERAARQMARLAGWPNCSATVDICRRLRSAGCRLPGEK